MKSFVTLLLIMSFMHTANAGVLERIRLEDAVQARVERGLKEYDKNIRVELSFSFRKNEPLPGTTMATSEDLQPNMVEEADITKINILVYTSEPELKPEIQEGIYRLIPVRKNRIRITHQQLADIPSAPTPAIRAQDLTEVTEKFAEMLSKILAAIVGASILLLGSLALYMHQRGLRKSTENASLLARSFGETAGGGKAPTLMPTPAPTMSSSQNELHQENPISSLPIHSLKELFADCYWCEKDAYAHWLWKQVSPEIKQKLFIELTFLKKYSSFFVSLVPKEENFHEHPYYLEPESLYRVSKDFIAQELKKNPDLWVLLSPLRQKTLALPIVEKLRVVQKTSTLKNSIDFKQSSPEASPQTVAIWSDVSNEDEQAIFKNPQIVPTSLRKNVRSLVWLSLRKNQFITDILAQYDARSLAEAWIGDAGVLDKLEKALPDKKLKLLKDYQSKIKPSRDSQIYQMLVDEGLADEAA